MKDLPSDWAFTWFLATLTPASLTLDEWLLFSYWQGVPSYVN